MLIDVTGTRLPQIVPAVQTKSMAPERTCETVSVSPEQLQLINGGTQSGIIMSYKEHNGLWGSTIHFGNVWSGRTYSVSMHGGDNWVNAGPDMVMVPPGQYSVVDGQFSNPAMTANMPLLRWWFRDFTVGPGEVVDLGTLKVTDVDVRSITSDGDRKSVV